MNSCGRIGRAAVVALLVACVDGPTGPGNHTPATLRLRVTLPAGTPAAWSPTGETLHVAVRRAGRVDPIVESSFLVGDSLGATLTVPLAYAVERFVVLGEARYDGLLLFIGFDVVQLRAASDTTITVAATYVGPGARAATYALDARDSTLSQGDTASLLPVVRDSSGQLIPNVPARYIAANPAVVAVDAGGLLTGQAGVPDTARVTGYLPMGLSSSLLVRRGPPVIPSVVTRTWLGNSAAWSAAGNWNPAGVPGAADTVEIVSSPNDPVLDANAAVAEVLIRGGNLTLNGHTLTVSGLFTTVGESGLGTLTMNQPSDTLRVLGNAVFQGGATTGLLTDGVLLVAGHFEQRNDASERATFQASGNHRTVLNGAGAQRFHPEGNASFGYLEFANTGGGIDGELEQQVAVARTLRVSTPVPFTGGDIGFDVEDSLVTVAGSSLATAELRLSGVMVIGGAFDVSLVQFAGENQLIQPGLAYQSVEVSGQARLGGPTSITGYLMIAGSNADLLVNGHTLNVALLNVGGGGSYEGSLTMQHPADTVVVSGDASIDMDTVVAHLTDGVLRLAGYVSIGSGSFPATLRASGNHRTVLDGAVTQQLLIAGRRPTFHHLEIANTGGGIEIPPVGEGVEFTVGGTLRISTPVALDGLDDASRHVSIDVGDSLVTVAGSAMNLAGLVLRGGISLGGGLVADVVEFAGTNQLVPVSAGYHSMNVSGTARLTGNTIFDGFVLVRGPGANLTLNGHRMVAGVFTTGGIGFPDGTLTMTSTADTLAVLDNAAFAGGPTTGLLTAGTLIVGGGFFQAETPTAFQPSGTHRTVLNGLVQQRVAFTDPGAATSHFHHLELANTAGGIWLESPVLVAGQLNATGAAQIISGTAPHLLSVTGADVMRLTLDTIPIAIGAGSIARFDSVTLRRQNRTGAQLAISHAGTAEPLTFTGLSFLTTPTTGAYVNATDVAPADGNILTIDLAGSQPADGSAQTVTAGGAVVNWVAGSLVEVLAQPDSIMLAPGDTVTFTAVVANATDTTVAWSVAEGAAGGTITAGGRYTAPAGLGSYHVVATSNADPAKHDTSLVVVVAGDFFRATGTMVVGRTDYTATLLADGRVLVTGGYSDCCGQVPEQSAEIYDPATGVWSLTGSMGTRRREHTATLLADGRVLVAGGGFLVGGDIGDATASAELFDPATGTFSPTGSLIGADTTACVGRRGHAAVLLYDGRVLVAGGTSRHNPGTFVCWPAQAEVYDPVSGTFALTDSLRASAPTMIRLVDGPVLVLGCEAPCGGAPGSVLWDFISETVTSTGPMVVNGTGTMTLLPGGRVLVAGRGTLTAAELYNPVGGTFSATGTSLWPDPGSAAPLPGGRVLVLSQSGSVAEVYDPGSGLFTATRFRAFPGKATAVPLLNGKVLVVTLLAELYTP